MTTNAGNTEKPRFADTVPGAGVADEDTRVRAYWKTIDKYRQLAEELHRDLMAGAGRGIQQQNRKTRNGRRKTS
ncbi:MAG: hypothetical protein JRI36_11930 [Deltaproteobacteria bacterium]|nr:hypothetical protein [Deltaproteobacteria bacterium]